MHQCMMPALLIMHECLDSLCSHACFTGDTKSPGIAYKCIGLQLLLHLQTLTAVAVC